MGNKNSNNTLTGDVNMFYESEIPMNDMLRSFGDARCNQFPEVVGKLLDESL